MDEPINGRDEDSAEQRRQRPDYTADEKRLAAKFVWHHPSICQNRRRESHVNDGGDYPDGNNPETHHAGSKKEIHKQWIVGQ